MNGLDWEDTIVGTATPTGDGARTIVRVSGPLSHRIAREMMESPETFDSPEIDESRWRRIFAAPATLRINDWNRSLRCDLYSWPA